MLVHVRQLLLYIICVCVCVWGGRSFGSCVGVLVVTVLVFTAFCIICTVSLYCSVYVYLFLFVLSVQV